MAFRRTPAALLLAVAVLAITACGSSSKSSSSASSSTSGVTSSTSPSTSSASKATAHASQNAGFTAQLNSLCARAQNEARTTGATTDANKFAALVEKYLPRFRALRPPASQEATYSQVVSDLAQEAALLKAGKYSAERQVSTRLRNLDLEIGARACAE